MSDRTDGFEIVELGGPFGIYTVRTANVAAVIPAKTDQANIVTLGGGWVGPVYGNAVSVAMLIWPGANVRTWHEGVWAMGEAPTKREVEREEVEAEADD